MSFFDTAPLVKLKKKKGFTGGFLMSGKETDFNIAVIARPLNSKAGTGNRVWAFRKSMTGQLDYAGVADSSLSFEGWQILEGSPFYSPSYYTYLCPGLACGFETVLSPECVLDNAGMFSYLTHIGPLLVAVDEGDGLLAAEIFSRRQEIFMRYPSLTLFLIKKVAAAGLFAWLYGRFEENTEFPAFYKSGAMFDLSCSDTACVFFEAARKDLSPEPQKESVEEMFIRYFKSQKEVTLTLGLVGQKYRDWNDGLDYLDSVIQMQVGNDFLTSGTRVKEAKQEFFGSLSAVAQAEPSNKYDPNAIEVFVDDIEAKLVGNSGKVKAGYLRATGAAIIRTARPSRFNYNARLVRIGNKQEGRCGIVIKITV